MERNVRPDYYDKDKIECIAVMKQWGVFEQFCIASVLKYLWRNGRKSQERLQDLRKARTYLDFLIEEIEKQEVDPQTFADIRAGIQNPWTQSVDNYIGS